MCARVCVDMCVYKYTSVIHLFRFVVFAIFGSWIVGGYRCSQAELERSRYVYVGGVFGAKGGVAVGESKEQGCGMVSEEVGERKLECRG